MRIPTTNLGNQSGLSHGSSLPTFGNQTRPLGIPPPQGRNNVSQPLIVKIFLVDTLIEKETNNQVFWVLARHKCIKGEDVYCGPIWYFNEYKFLIQTNEDRDLANDGE
jgi:hypothetical protein